MSSLHRPAAVLLIVAAWIAAWPASPLAHDIPDKVIVQAFVKPEGHRLHVLLRLPLILLMDMDLPKRGPGYLELAYMDRPLRESAAATASDIAVFENDSQLESDASEMRISLPSDRSFATYGGALACIKGPRLPPESDIFWNQGFFDLHLEYPIRSDRSRFSARLRLARGLGDKLQTAVRFITPDEVTHAFEFTGDMERVWFDPRWHQAAWLFVKSGFRHILSGTDHLLFLLCLIIPVRQLRSLIVVVTSFTLAHSITLLASAFTLAPGGPWFPPLIETLIAVSIFFMAIENIVAPAASLRWLVSFAFGLVHGFGFSFALKDSLQFAGSHLLLSLASFNIGVELGQLLVLIVVAPALAALFSRVVSERLGVVILSALVAHVGWHWMIDRGTILWRAGWPVPDLATAAGLARWVFVAMFVGGLGWFLVVRLWRRGAGAAPRARRDLA